MTKEIVYTKPGVKLCLNDKAMTAKKMKTILGWQELSSDSKEEPILKDLEGNKIICVNNTTNRPLDIGWCKKLAQDILRGHFKFNFENFIVGQYGSILSGQHRGIALILAVQMWNQNPEAYPHWKEEPTIELALAVGAPEDEATINTLDTNKPRSLEDVLYRSSYFEKHGSKDRKKLSKICDHAVRYLWDRTGVKDAFDIKRTHSESMSFIERHKTILKCAEHLFIESSDDSLKIACSTGYAAGMMYLMAASDTNPSAYLDMDDPDEKVLDFNRLELAEEFWTLLATGEEFENVRRALVRLHDLADDEESGLWSTVQDCKETLIMKAWNAYRSNDKIETKDIKLKFSTDEDGWKTLNESVTMGGIDFGGVREDAEEEIEEDSKSETPTPRKTTVKKVKKKTTKKDIIKPGVEVLVKDKDGEEDDHWEGTVYSQETPGEWKVKVKEGFHGAGKVFDVSESIIHVL